ncbi:hypothetical protein BDV93DRAFT_576777, partial [Ceratobasidium sp. AG-I]
FIYDASGQDFRRLSTYSSTQSSCKATDALRVDGRLVDLIETPSFGPTDFNSDGIFDEISAFLRSNYTTDPKLDGIIYMHRIISTRISSDYQRLFSHLLKLCRNESRANLVIITTMWGDPPQLSEITSERLLLSYECSIQSALVQGARYARYVRSNENRNRAHDIIRMFISVEKHEKELEEVNKKHQKELDEINKKHRKEVKRLRGTLRRKDEEMVQQAETYYSYFRDRMAERSDAFAVGWAFREREMQQIQEGNERRRRQDEEEIAQLKSDLAQLRLDLEEASM